MFQQIEVRAIRSWEDGNPALNNNREAAEWILEHVQPHTFAEERFGVLYLNAMCEPLGVQIVDIGDEVSCYAMPKRIIQAGLLVNADSMVGFHNHPGRHNTEGLVVASKEDIISTKTLIAIGHLHMIPMRDALIFGPNRKWISIPDENPWLADMVMRALDKDAFEPDSRNPIDVALAQNDSVEYGATEWLNILRGSLLA